MVSFRGASVDAMAALADQVGEVAEASAAKIAEDLFSAAATFRTEGTLRRFVTDQSVPAEARSGMVTDLFTVEERLKDTEALVLIRERTPLRGAGKIPPPARRSAPAPAGRTAA